MNDLIKNKQAEINFVCKNHFVKTLYVFGSVLNDNFSAKSDIDFLYKININSLKIKEKLDFDYVDNLLSLEEKLTSLFDRKIDLVPETYIHNKYLRESIENTKQLLYAE